METKKVFKYFTIYNYEKEQDYLREMHKSGWKFIKVTGLGTYTFEKCEPEDVVYQLDYNQEGIKNKDEYLQMFADCGWEYLMVFAGYSYFRKPANMMSGDEEIFCDKESRLEMMRRVIKDRTKVLAFLFIITTISQLLMIDDLLESIKTGNCVLLILELFCIFAYLISFSIHFVGYIKYKRRISSFDIESE